MKKLEITILPEDFRAAPKGFQNVEAYKGCVLWQALKRLYPEEEIIKVGGCTVTLGEDGYFIPHDTIWGSGNAEYPAHKINELSLKAKDSLDGIPTVTMELIQIEF